MDSKACFHNIRIAPTPSGYLHIGNAMSFLITHALAQQAGATLLLRIDDMDRERIRREYVEDIFETLHFLEIEWQEGAANYDDFEAAHSQQHRLPLYEQALQELRREGKVFACVCSRKDLLTRECLCFERHISLDNPETSWKLQTDIHHLLTIKSVDGKMFTDALPQSMQPFIIRKKDGLPSYHLTSLIDDEHFGIDAIVRGEDLWASTLAQQYLAFTLGKSFFQEVLFYHHPLIYGENGKLSKSAGSASVKHLRSEGKNRKDVIEIIEKKVTDDVVKRLLQRIK